MNRGLSDFGVWWHTFGQPYIAPDDRPLAYFDAPQDTGIGVYRHIIANDGVTRGINGVTLTVGAKTMSPKRNPLVEVHTAAYDGSLAYNNTCAMVNTEALAYLGTRVNINTSQGVSHLGYHTSNKDITVTKQVSHAMKKHGCDGWVTKNHLGVALGRGVTIIHGLDIGHNKPS